MSDQIQHAVDLDLEPAEASGLVASESDELREHLGWDPLYWTVLDDGPVEECIALIGQRAGPQDPTANWDSLHALHRADVPVMAFSPKYLEKTLGKARRRAVADDQPWAWRLAHDDSPVNIEGASFTSDGRLLLGLRVPVSREGHALVVEVEHADRLFDPFARHAGAGPGAGVDGVR